MSDAWEGDERAQKHFLDDYSYPTQDFITNRNPMRNLPLALMQAIHQANIIKMMDPDELAEWGMRVSIEAGLYTPPDEVNVAAEQAIAQAQAEHAAQVRISPVTVCCH